MDGVARRQCELVGHPPGLPGERGVEFHDHEVLPSLVEVPLSGRDLPLRETFLSAGTGECCLTLAVGDPARCTRATLVKELQDKLASFLREKRLDKGARVEVRAQNLSSPM